MPREFAGNQARVAVAGRLIKQARRRVIKQARKRNKKLSRRPPWIELPRNVTANILHRLGGVEILETAQKVCTTWRSVCKDPAMWRVIDMWNLGDLHDMPYDLVKMCRHAVDRSQGQLVDINLQYFASDELLDYIAQRSGNLRRLRLVSSYELSDEGLSEAIKRFPNLEELHIILIFYGEETIETVGRSCPLLRSFAYNNRASSTDDYNMGDEDAYAIARSMPELRHLQLMGNGLTNEGLKAIIDGCPRLESLDLRRCFHVKLRGDLEKRCSTQIKSLRYPDESTSGYEFILDDSGYSGPDSPDNEFWFFRLLGY